MSTQIPLAERIRLDTIDKYIGQEHLYDYNLLFDNKIIAISFYICGPVNFIHY
ncbi:MAG: hypothetical protein SGJ04_08640 [Bacteroidota bacterium]|nr:hypothetical protein [Bacteroidota bacterium]